MQKPAPACPPSEEAIVDGVVEEVAPAPPADPHGQLLAGHVADVFAKYFGALADGNTTPVVVLAHHRCPIGRGLIDALSSPGFSSVLTGPICTVMSEQFLLGMVNPRLVDDTRKGLKDIRLPIRVAVFAAGAVRFMGVALPGAGVAPSPFRAASAPPPGGPGAADVAPAAAAGAPAGGPAAAVQAVPLQAAVPPAPASDAATLAAAASPPAVGSGGPAGAASNGAATPRCADPGAAPAHRAS